MESIQVALSNHTCIAGGTISGACILNFPWLHQQQIEEVHLNFRGSVYTFISSARTDQNETRDIDIVRDQVSVWSRGSAYSRRTRTTSASNSCSMSQITFHLHTSPLRWSVVRLYAMVWKQSVFARERLNRTRISPILRRPLRLGTDSLWTRVPGEKEGVQEVRMQRDRDRRLRRLRERTKYSAYTVRT